MKIHGMRIFAALLGQSKFSALERQALTAVSAELSKTAREVFIRQVNQINLIQRDAKGMEANLYVTRRQKPHYDEQILFPLRRDVQLANLEMFEASAEVWMVNGRIFSIKFDKPPEKIQELSSKIEKVSILHDPMVPLTEASISNDQRREEVLNALKSKLPEDYLQLVGETNWSVLNHWVIYRIHDIRKITAEDGSYYILADKEGMGVIAVKGGEFTGQLYYLDYGDCRGEKIGVSLLKFLKEFDGGKVIGRF
ncbi:MAG: hypothetical protein ACO1QB_02825 [Verrucomicrobiales bacterium]